MFSYQNFDDVFGFDSDYSYDEGIVQDIDKNRKALEGLFIDKVMKVLGIKRPARYYPPKTNGDLRNLHKAIVESTGADIHKISVLYYLLLNIDFPTGGRDHSTTFEKNCFLPGKYQIYMKGLWHLDRQEFEDALEYLTYPSLIPDFSDEILEVLVRRSDNDLTLALAYYHTVQPTLKSQSAIECLFSAIGRHNVTEAYYFARNQPEHTQRHMFEMLISLVLHNSPAETIADRSAELVNLPFTSEEEEWFEEYLLRGEGSGLRKAKDTVLFRRIATGKFTEALAMKDLKTRAVGGLNWNHLTKGVQDGLGPRLGS